MPSVVVLPKWDRKVYQWCQETFATDQWFHISEKSPISNEVESCRWYFVEDADATMFSLKWSNK